MGEARRVTSSASELTTGAAICEDVRRDEMQVRRSETGSRGHGSSARTATSEAKKSLTVALTAVRVQVHKFARQAAHPCPCRGSGCLLGNGHPLARQVV